MGTSAERERGVMGKKKRVYFRPRFRPLKYPPKSDRERLGRGNEYQVFLGGKGEERAKRRDSEIPPLLAPKEGLILRL